MTADTARRPGHPHGPGGPRGSGRGTRGPARTVVLGVIALVIVVAIIAVSVFVLQARAVDRSATKASETMQTLTRQLGSDPDAAAATLPKLQRQLAEAGRDADASVFAAGAHVPVIGADVSAARHAIDALTLLSHQALPVLVSGAQYVDLDNHTLRGGLSSLPKLAALTPQLVPALNAFTDAKRQIDSIDVGDLHGDTKDSIARLQQVMDTWGTKLAPFTSAAQAVEKGAGALDVWRKALSGAAG